MTDLDNEATDYPYLYLYCDSGDRSYGRVMIRGLIKKPRWSLFKKLTKKFPNTKVEIEPYLKGQPEISSKELYDFIKVYKDKDTILKLVEADQILHLKPCLGLLEDLESEMKQIQELVFDNIIITIPAIDLSTSSENSKKIHWNSQSIVINEKLFNKLEKKINKLSHQNIKDIFGYDKLIVDYNIKCNTLDDLWKEFDIRKAKDVFSEDNNDFHPYQFESHTTHEFFKFFL